MVASIGFNILTDFHIANNTVHAPNDIISYSANSYFVFLLFHSQLPLSVCCRLYQCESRNTKTVANRACKDRCLSVCCVYSTLCTFHRRKHKSWGKFGEKIIIDWFKTCYAVMNERRMNHNKEWCKDKVTIANQEPKTKNLRIPRTHARNREKQRWQNETFVIIEQQ